MTLPIKPGLIIFDCDGVLVDSERITSQVIVENLARFGIDLTVEECDLLFVGTSIPFIADWAKDRGADLTRDWRKQVHEECYKRLRGGVSMIDGVETVLNLILAQNIPHCVASNGEREKMSITLGQNGWWQHFESRCFSAYEVGIAKPEPGLFLAAASSFGVDPGNCVVIEDSASGAKAARLAGMRCFAHAPNGSSQRLLNEGAVLFSDMRELPKLLGIRR